MRTPDGGVGRSDPAPQGRCRAILPPMNRTDRLHPLVEELRSPAAAARAARIAHVSDPAGNRAGVSQWVGQPAG